ncbi:hypothetical protein PPROV_000847800 [Pycnococcus provasolii]|uniref:Uncharacterized protein n=1 Tax=Pycnococcus provasolii TaxID=41880 RepID=A0A830HSU8_9CHLO|nr:hypothetical protein PPROV_000847800 [Pycnococcus provasolii]
MSSPPRSLGQGGQRYSMSPSSPASSLAAASSAFGSSSAFGGGSSAFGAVQYRVGAPVVGSGGVAGSRGGGAPASGAAAAIGGAAGRQRRPSVGDVLPGAQQGGGGGGSLASVLAGLSENTAAGADRGQHAAPRNKPRLLQDMGAAATQNNENEEESTPGMPPRNARGPVGARHGLSNVSSVGSGDMVLGPGMHGNARSSLQSNSNLPSPTGSSASGMDTGRNRVRFSTQADLEQRRANSQHPTFARTSQVQKAQAHAANAPAVEIPSSGKDPWAAMQGVNMPMSTNFTGLGDNSSALAPVSQSAVAAPLEDPNAGFKARPTYEKPDSFWTVNHLKMLYLISKYSHSAQSIHEKEKWIRRLPLAVFIYEGVVQKVFEYDYAPMSELIKSKRVYLNISQEGLDDLDDLVEGKLVKALRMTTKEHQSVQAYQIAAEGRSLILKRLSEEDRQLVDELITVEGRLIHIIWEDDHFTLRNDLVSRESTITDTEDVSYVCSPYIPKTLRRPGGPVMSSNAHRASESATKESTIRDDLDALNEYLAQKAVVSEDGDADRLTSVNRVAWVERDSGKWEGYVPRIELVYDEKHGFLLSVYLQLTRRASEPARLRPETLKIRFLTELQEYGVLKATDAADVIDATKPVHGQGDDGSGDGSGGRTYLKIRKPGDKFYREVPFGAQTYLGMVLISFFQNTSL